MQKCNWTFTATLLAFAVQLPAEACSKKVRWYDDSPYFEQAADGSVTGLTAEVAREALRRSGCKAEFVKMPFARALVELENGRLDVLPDVLRKADRRRFARFSQPAAIGVPNVLFMSVQSRRQYQPQKIEDLVGTGFRLGVQIGVAYGGKFEALAARPEFKRQLSLVTERRNAWKMVALGRLDGMVADFASGTVELRQLGLSGQVQPTKVVVSTEAPAYAFSRKTTGQAFVKRFNRELESMAADGSYRALMDKYMPGALPH
jgi:polar amino acid transport system substrate-binding protein